MPVLHIYAVKYKKKRQLITSEQWHTKENSNFAARQLYRTTYFHRFASGVYPKRQMTIITSSDRRTRKPQRSAMICLSSVFFFVADARKAQYIPWIVWQVRRVFHASVFLLFFFWLFLSSFHFFHLLFVLCFRVRGRILSLARRNTQLLTGHG